MKTLAKMMLIVVMALSLPLQAEDFDASKYVAGRVRFVEGDSAFFSFSDKESKVGLDYLVLLGASFSTEKGRLELVDINQNTYWFDKESSFHFESVDPQGERTVLFLGKGSFVVNTAKPFSLMTGAGSILFPDNGRYLIVKDAFGKDKVYVSTLAGEDPSIIKKAGVFNRLKIDSDVQNAAIVEWADKKFSDWKKTMSRAKIFSNVAIMSPYIADTKANESVDWVKVDYVKPYTRAQGIIRGNDFYPVPSLIHAYGLMPAATLQMNDFELMLWFETNRYNAIKWDWTVERGWHAAFYFDPLAGFGAEHAYASYFDMYDYYSGRYRYNPWYLASLRNPYCRSEEYYQIVNAERARLRRDRGIFGPRVPVKVQRDVIRRVNQQSTVKLRMATDVQLTRAQRVIALDFTNREVVAANERIKYDRFREGMNSTTRRRVTASSTSTGTTRVRHSVSSGSSSVVRTPVRTSTVSVPVRSTTYSYQSGYRGK